MSAALFKSPRDYTPEDVKTGRFALAWTRHKTADIYPIISANHLGHLQQPIEALRIPPTTDQAAALDNASEFDLGFPYTFFKTDPPYLPGASSHASDEIQVTQLAEPPGGDATLLKYHPVCFYHIHAPRLITLPLNSHVAHPSDPPTDVPPSSPLSLSSSHYHAPSRITFPRSSGHLYRRIKSLLTHQAVAIQPS
nr:hypothetical protein L204_06146 [Cryptococcus depauperatus CBS 7855]